MDLKFGCRWCTERFGTENERFWHVIQKHPGRMTA